MTAVAANGFMQPLAGPPNACSVSKRNPLNEVPGGFAVGLVIEFGCAGIRMSGQLLDVGDIDPLINQIGDGGHAECHWAL